MKPTPLNRAARLAASVFEKYQADLHNYLVLHLRAGQDSADLAQEVYLRLLRLEKSELVRQPRAYVYTIASHVASQLRMRAARGLVTFDSEAAQEAAEHPELPAGDESTDRADTEDELERILAVLPPVHRATFVLCKRDGMSYVEIARALDISVHTVKKYVHESTVRIRAHLWQKGDRR
ncbi:RNA polymerase sigma factor [Steroidobacter sp.]|uniref:RNA polymerase sigma factor n=1 Tax=Steroidobacter sp. TaxID=1978227 RepID=UPI001A6220D9|nr:RNA polymerase sigma factor [Steroidobacter sp.]MBL8271871.1 RNA polymerase sigma factor [Steroidobacter sp.]